MCVMRNPVKISQRFIEGGLDVEIRPLTPSNHQDQEMSLVLWFRAISTASKQCFSSSNRRVEYRQGSIEKSRWAGRTGGHTREARMPSSWGFTAQR